MKTFDVTVHFTVQVPDDIDVDLIKNGHSEIDLSRCSLVDAANRGVQSKFVEYETINIEENL